jgi:hypothetical protein
LYLLGINNGTNARKNDRALLVSRYNKSFKSAESCPPLNGGIMLGAVIIKNMLKLSDRDTVQQIQENVFMQYFLDYSNHHFDKQSPEKNNSGTHEYFLQIPPWFKQ